jgi:uncharacterized membrane protein HdeD (DUF308 family)
MGILMICMGIFGIIAGALPPHEEMLKNILYILLGIALQFFIYTYVNHSPNLWISSGVNAILSITSGWFIGYGSAHLFFAWMEKKGKWL